MTLEMKKTDNELESNLSEELTPDQHEVMINTIATDKYAGQGGSYIYDPVTGTRTPAPPEK